MCGLSQTLLAFRSRILTSRSDEFKARDVLLRYLLTNFILRFFGPSYICVSLSWNKIWWERRVNHIICVRFPDVAQINWLWDDYICMQPWCRCVLRVACGPNEKHDIQLSDIIAWVSQQCHVSYHTQLYRHADPRQVSTNDPMTSNL